MSTDGLKVLHIDRNNYYGAESASINLTQLFEKFDPSKKPPASLGNSRDYNVDLMPKFLMASGKLVKMLILTDVTKYLEFKQVDGSYVFKEGKVHKVPATDGEAIKTPLVGFFEKRRLKNFIVFVQDFDEADAKTHHGHDVKALTAEGLYAKFGLEAGTIDFLGHAMALYHDDTYLKKPALDLVRRLKLYGESLMRYGKSPFIYPLYGLGELPQAFARLCAVYGGTYMLHTPVDEIVTDASGCAVGVRSNGQFAKCKFVVGDPSYFPSKVRKTQQVVRAICILSHPITPGDEHSTQIILPQNQVGRKHGQCGQRRADSRRHLRLPLLAHSQRGSSGQVPRVCVDDRRDEQPQGGAASGDSAAEERRRDLLRRVRHPRANGRRDERQDVHLQVVRPVEPF